MKCLLQNHHWKPHLTAPKPPLLQTSLRARPPKIKSSDELEKEEVEKIPRFKAKPLNRKVGHLNCPLIIELQYLSLVYCNSLYLMNSADI